MAVSSNTSSSLLDLVVHDWKQINLPSLRHELDDSASKMDTFASTNKSAREELAKQTKDFKSYNKDEKLRKFGSLLKAYQQHIGRKDEERKFIFDAFLRIYKVLSEAPDPIDALQNGQIQILQLQSQLIDFEATQTKLSQYEKEFNNLKSQEITVKKLREQMKRIEREQQQHIEAALLTQENEFEQKFKNELSERDAKYDECKLQLKNVQHENMELRREMDELQNSLLAQSLTHQQNLEVRDSTQGMLEEELERANTTVYTLTKQGEALTRQQHSNADIALQDEDRTEKDLIAFEMETLKKRLSEARETGAKYEADIERLRKEQQRLQQSHEHSTSKLQQTMEKLRDKLQRLPDENEYVLLKEKVRVLQRQFMSQGDAEADEEPEERGSLPIDVAMEALFNTKLQALQSEVTTMRLDIHSKDEALSAFGRENAQLKRQNAEHRQLIAKLENDLTKYVTYKHGQTVGVESTTATQSQSYDIVGGGPGGDDNNGANERESEPLLYRILNEPVHGAGGGEEERKVKEESMSIQIDDGSRDEDAPQPPTSVAGKTETVSDRDGNSAFSIICEQRNRFRTKSEALEQSKLKLEAHLERIASDNTQLKRENVELYAKIKYLENYNSVKKSHKQLQHHQQQQHKRRNMLQNDSVTLMKYENLYEEQMNPFAQFKRRETESRINSLDWTEWIAFIVSSTVLSKRLFRLLTVFYAIALHLLIFFTMMHEYRSHGVFDSHLHCNDQPPAIQLELPPDLAADVGLGHINR